MDTSTLRWILIGVGIIVIASILLFGNPEKRRKPKASRREKRRAANRKAAATPRREPTLDGAGLPADAAAEEGEPGNQRELDIGAAEPPAHHDRPAPSAPRKPRKPAGPPPDKIVSVFLLARDNHVITGADLLQATVNTGMEFGDMDVFHRLPEGGERPVFSLANAAKPGHFERDAWNTFETSGVALFMALPGPVSALDAWDAMLATARRTGEILNAELLDGDRNPFTRQHEAQIREEMREYDRKKSRPA